MVLLFVTAYGILSLQASETEAMKRRAERFGPVDTSEVGDNNTVVPQ